MPPLVLVRGRITSLLITLAMAALLGALSFTGCGGRDNDVTAAGKGQDGTGTDRVDADRTAADIADFWREPPDVPLSPDLRPAMLAGRAALQQPEPQTKVTRDIIAYNDLAIRIQRKDTRQEAGDELYTRWRQEPENFLWINLAAVYNYLLRRKEDRNAMYALPALADTTAAVGSFVAGRRYYRYSSRGRFYRRAEQQLADLDSLQQVWLTLQLAGVDGDQGDNLAGVQRLLRWLPRVHTLGGNRLAAFYWRRIAALLTREDRLDDALHAAALAAASAHEAGDRYREVQSGIIMAGIFEKRREHTRGLRQYEACAELARRKDFPWLVLRSLNKAAALCAAMGDPRRALACDRRNLAYSLAIPDSLNTPRNMMNMAYDFRLLGRLDSCLVYQQRARKWVETFHDARNLAMQPVREAEYYCQIGDFATADSLLAAARGCIGDGGTAQDEAELLLELVRQGLEMGQPDVAYRAIGRLSELRGKYHDRIADQNLRAGIAIATADFLGRQGEFARAQEAQELAARAVADRGGEGQSWSYQRCRGELALLRSDLRTAAAAFSDALALAAAGVDPDRLATSRFWLGHVLLEQGKFAAARELFRRESPDSAFGGRFRTRLSTLLFLGISHAREGQHGKALNYFRSAQKLATRHSPTDLMAELHLATGRSLVGIDSVAAAERSLLRARELLRREDGHRTSEELRAFTRDARRDLSEILVGLYHDHPGLTGDADPARHTLLLAEENRWRPLSSRRTIASASVTIAALVDREIMPVLAFLVGRHRSFAWLISHEGVTLFEMPGRPELRGRLLPVLADLNRPENAIEEEALAQLGRMLLAPAAAVWPAETVLGIVPDDLLCLVPWNALLLPATGNGRPTHSVLEHGPLVEAPSLAGFGFTVAPATETAAAANRRPARRNLLAIGLDSPYPGAGQGTVLPALRHAEEEAQLVASLWSAGSAVLKVGTAAAWDRIVASGLEDFDVIHLATHATAHRGLPERSTLRLFGADSGSPLTVPMVSRLRLAADLIYLSCCETTGGQAHGGLMDFARSFLAAGARSVIAATNRVDDESARYLASRFYFHWQAGMNKAAALRAALLDVRAADPRWRHPYYWASYRLIGRGT